MGNGFGYQQTQVMGKDEWLNPPYGDQCWKWLHRLSNHKDGIALIFARTGAAGFFREVWNKAHTLLFIEGRLYFYHVNGVRAKHNSGGDSVLVSYNQQNADVLQSCSIKGKRIIL